MYFQSHLNIKDSIMMQLLNYNQELNPFNLVWKSFCDIILWHWPISPLHHMNSFIIFRKSAEKFNICRLQPFSFYFWITIKGDGKYSIGNFFQLSYYIQKSSIPAAQNVIIPLLCVISYTHPPTISMDR